MCVLRGLDAALEDLQTEAVGIQAECSCRQEEGKEKGGGKGEGGRIEDREISGTDFAW